MRHHRKFFTTLILLVTKNLFYDLSYANYPKIKRLIGYSILGIDTIVIVIDPMWFRNNYSEILAQFVPFFLIIHYQNNRLIKYDLLHLIIGNHNEAYKNPNVRETCIVKKCIYILYAQLMQACILKINFLNLLAKNYIYLFYIYFFQMNK